MKKLIKQCVGIDVDQKLLVVSLGRMYDDYAPEIYAYKTFSNNEKGFIALILWVKNHTDGSIPVLYVMEATGVYHESFAYYLDSKGHDVAVVLPNKISNYFRTLDVKTSTDKTMSETIARFGLERKLDTWHRPDPRCKMLRQITRERDQLVQERTLVKNQLHAEKAEAQPNKQSLKRMEARIKMLNKQIGEIKVEIPALIKEDKELEKSVELICSIPGIGLLTAAIVIAETNGFELIRNKRQLASYAGLDVIEKQSGTSVKKKPKISKRGNRHLRKALYMPALAAIGHDEHFKAVFVRLVSKHGIKRKACVAVQRKLLEMIYTIFKTKTKYDKEYLVKKQTEKEQQEQKQTA